MALPSLAEGHLGPERAVERIVLEHAPARIAGICRISPKQVGRRITKGAPFLKKLRAVELLDLGAVFPSLSTAIIEDQLGEAQPADPIMAPTLAVELGVLLNRAAALLAEGNGDHRWTESEIAPLREALPEIARRIPHLLRSLDAARIAGRGPR
jgi:hypothetical protein